MIGGILQDEMARWREKKSREENVSMLRKKLEDAERRQQDISERLMRRERRIAQMQREESSRVADQERLNLMVAELKRGNETLLRERAEATALLTESQSAVSGLNQQVSQLKKVASSADIIFSLSPLQFILLLCRLQILTLRELCVRRSELK